MWAGPDGNERLTAVSGAVLFLLLAAEGVTILFIRPLLSAHVFIGMLLVPPVALKLASTGWRFLRYYRGTSEYVAKGPPLLPLRLLAPLVVVSTLVLFGTGIALIVRGPGGGLLLGLHKASFVVWLAATAVHVLAYVWRVPRLALAARSPWLLVAGVIAVGAVLAGATVRYAHPWVQWAANFHGDH
ncbi:MAG TPA: hypothetical protein VKC62_10155 [Gaiellaceae bacterium]|nr:hypothetical protein [Gaiellaceae bacterium]